MSKLSSKKNSLSSLDPASEEKHLNKSAEKRQFEVFSHLSEEDDLGDKFPVRKGKFSRGNEGAQRLNSDLRIQAKNTSQIINPNNRKTSNSYLLDSTENDGMALREHDLSRIDKFQKSSAQHYSAARKAQSQFRLKAQLVRTEIHSTHNLSPARTERRRKVSNNGVISSEPRDLK